MRARNVGPSRENPGQAPDSVRTRVARPLGGGGITPCKGATRRRHADRALRMAQNPHRSGGRRSAWRPGGRRRAWQPGGPGRSAEAAKGLGRSTRKRQQHPAQANFARNFRRSFFEIAQKRCNSNEVISMFEQVARELRAKLMGEWPVGPQAASHRRACPVSGRSAARPCHGLGCSPGVPRRPSRTRRGRTRGRSTGRRAPWPRSCRAP